MKAKVGWVVSWSLYWIGDLISRVMRVPCLWSLYWAYNWFMVKSNDIQDWAGIDNGPWDTMEEKQ